MNSNYSGEPGISDELYKVTYDLGKQWMRDRRRRNWENSRSKRIEAGENEESSSH